MSTRTRAPWWLVPAWRARSTPAAWISFTALTLCIGAIIAMLHLSLAAGSSPEQRRNQTVGAYEHVVILPADDCSTSAGCLTEHQLPSVLRADGATSFSLLRSTKVWSPQWIRSPRLLEGTWAQNTFPERYRLVDGRWPTVHGEIAVARPWEVPLGGSVALYDRAFSMKVVGVIEDTTTKLQDTLLAPPGTYSALRTALAAHGGRYHLPSSSMIVRYSGVDSDKLTRDLARAVSSSVGLAQDVLEQEISLSRDDAPRNGDSWLTRLTALNPLKGWLPLVLIPLLVSVASAFAGHRRSIRTLTIASTVGLPIDTLLRGMLLIQITTTVIACLSGTVLGTGAGHLLRPTLASQLDHPLSPPLIPATPLLLVSLVSLAGIIPAARLLKRSQTAKQTRDAPRTARVSRRRWFAVQAALAAALAATAIILYTPGLPWNTPTLRLWPLLGCVSAALGSGVLAAALKDARGTAPLGVTLALRRLSANTPSTAITASLTALAVTLPLMLGVMTAIDKAIVSRTVGVPYADRGQAVLPYSGSSTGETPPEVVKLFEGYTGLKNPVELREALAYPDLEHAHSDSGVGIMGIVRTLTSAHDLERLIGRDLSPQERSAFDEGALLVPERQNGTNVPPGDTLTVRYSPDGRPRFGEPHPGQTALSVFPLPGVRSGSTALLTGAGFIRDDAARRYGWFVEPPSRVYTGVYGPKADLARKASTVKKFDPAFVKVWKEPETIRLSPIARWMQAVLTVLLGVVSFLLSVRILAETRVLSLALQTLGLRRRTRTAMVVTSITLIAALPLVLGIVAATVMTSLSIIRADVDINPFFSLPWPDIWGTMALGVLCAYIGPALALRREARRGVPGD